MQTHIPNEASCAEHSRNGHILAVPSDDAVRDLDVVGVVQGDGGHLEVFEVDRSNNDVGVLIAVNAWRGESACAGAEIDERK